MSCLTTSMARHQVDSGQGHEASDLSNLHHNKKEITMNLKDLVARHAEGTRLWNEMVERELLQKQQFAAHVRDVDADLRESADPDVPYDPITEIDFLTDEEAEDIGDVE